MPHKRRNAHEAVVKIPVSTILILLTASAVTIIAAAVGVITSQRDWDIPLFNFLNNLQVIAWTVATLVIIGRGVRLYIKRCTKKTTDRLECIADEFGATVATMRNDILATIAEAKEDVLAAAEQQRIGQYIEMAESAEPRLRSVVD